MSDLLDLEVCAAADVVRIGGKAHGLGLLLAAGLEVPPGFVVLTDAYRSWVAANDFAPQIARMMATDGGVGADQSASRRVRDLLAGAGLRSDAIDAAYATLPGGRAAVAVRSSAIGEDAADASFAGQQDTLLWRRGAEDVRAAIVSCWSSLFTPEAMSYRRRLGRDPGSAQMAVVVQQMIEAEASGVMFTIDPRSGDRSQITIESTHGLGLPLVGGEITPDLFSVDKVTLEIRSRAIATKPFADLVDVEADTVRRTTLDDATAAESSLSDTEVTAIAALGKRVELVLGGPADIEWALGPGPSGPRHLFLLQARSETVWSNTAPAVQPAGPTTALERIAASMRNQAG